MVYSIDAFLIGIEFNQEELEAICHRRFLYAAIGAMLALNIALAGLVMSA